MTNEEFEILVGRLEQEAQASPGRYKAQVLGLALLGYGYIFFILAIFLGLTLGLGFFLVAGHHWLLLKKLGLPLVIVVGLIARALWVRIKAPTGIALKRNEYPALFKMLDKIRKRLKGPRFHKVLLTDDFNAAVSQIPLLGIFGWQRNYLILGLPLMQALTPEQFVAVLAHEYGHLSGSHSRFAGWIYRVRQTWRQVNQAFEEGGNWTQLIFSKFFDWYAPYFWAYSFVLARADEYEADRCAARVVGPRHAADALINVHVKGAVVDEEFWPSLYKRADKEVEPVARAYHDLAVILRTPGKGDQLQHWLQTSLERSTDVDDTHPSLADRLKGLGEEARIPPEGKGDAARTFLEPHYADLVARLSEDWREGVKNSWQERHSYVQDSLVKLGELEARRDTLSADETVDYALLVEEFQPEQDPLPIARLAYQRDEADLGANFMLGRLLIERDDEGGIAYVERAMQANENYVKPGSKLIYNYLMEKDREDQAQSYYDRFYEQAKVEEERADERDNLRNNDSFGPHQLSAEALQALVVQLKPYKRLGKAWLVRKQTQLSDAPLYVFAFKIAWCHWGDDDATKKFQNKLSEAIDFPGECFVLGYTSEHKKLFKKIRAIKDGRIYPA